MTDNARVRICLKTGEVELEGSENFVDRSLEKLRDIFDIIRTAKETENGGDSEEYPSEELSEAAPSSGSIPVPESFGEWLHKFPRAISQVDKVLVAGYYAQKMSLTEDFKTNQARKLLLEQGEKLTNPSHSLKALERNRHVIRLKKEGKKLNLFRVSRDGTDRLRFLLEPK